MLILLILTSCWNNRDITDIAIVVGVGLDQTEDEKLQLTVQIVNPSAIQSEDGGGSGGQNIESSIELSASGETIFDAARSLIGKTNKKLFFSHIQAVIIGERLAKSGLKEVLDFFERDHETRRKVDILIAKGGTAKQVLETKNRIEDQTSIHLSKSLETSKAIGKIQRISLFDILQQIQEAKRSIVIGIVEPNDGLTKSYIEEMQLQGSSIFKGGKLQGYFTPIETRGFLWVNDKINNTIITIPNPLNKEKTLSIEVLSSKGKIHAKLENQNLLLTIKVKGEGNIGENLGYGDLTKPHLVAELEKNIEKEIKREIQQAVNLAQKKYESDIFGFGTALYKEQPKEWFNLEDNWEKIFSKTPIEIDVKFTLKGAGLIKEPVHF